MIYIGTISPSVERQGHIIAQCEFCYTVSVRISAQPVFGHLNFSAMFTSACFLILLLKSR